MSADPSAPVALSVWDATLTEARKAIYGEDGRGLIGEERPHLDQRVARALLARTAPSAAAADIAGLIDAVEERADGVAAAFGGYCEERNVLRQEKWIAERIGFNAALAALRLACGVAP